MKIGNKIQPVHCLLLVSETKHWLSTLIVPGFPSNIPYHLSSPSKGINYLGNNFILQRISIVQYLKKKWGQNSKFGARQMDTNQLLQLFFFLCLELYFFAKAIEQWSANFYCKEPGSKHFMLCGPDGLVATTQFCCSRKTSTDNV